MGDGDSTVAKPWATIAGAAGNHSLLSVGLKNVIGVGWDWSATLAGNLVNYDVRFARDATSIITINDGRGGSLTSPPLVAIRRSKRDNTSGLTVELGGICYASHKLRAGGHSFPSYRYAFSSSIIGDLAARAGVTISGFPNFQANEEDIKQATLASAFQRWLEAAGYEYGVGLDGVVYCRDPWDTDGACLLLSMERDTQIDYSDPIDKLTLGKRTGLSGEYRQTFTTAGPHSFELGNPLSNCQSADESAAGSIDLIAYWNGDPNAGGGLIKVDASAAYEDVILPPVTQTWPCTHITLMVIAPITIPPGSGAISATIKVMGSIPDLPGGLDTEFLFTYPNNSGHFGEPAIIDSILPNQAYALSRAPALLWMRNKNSDTVSLSGPLSCQPFIWQTFTQDGFPYKVDSVSYELSAGAATTSIMGVRL